MDKRKKYSILDMQAIAERKNGKCLSEKYINSITKLKWQCSQGHIWEQIPGHIVRGVWCKKCSFEKLGNDKRHSIEFVRSLATKFGGTLISREYKRFGQKLMWQCSMGHTFSKSAQSVSLGNWCSYCNQNIGEAIVRVFFEKLFGTRFLKTRPKWLRSESGTLLELDGYSKKLKLAFEHQGMHHYEMRKIFHKDKESLDRRLKLDKLKRKLCNENGVTLIEIPQVPTKIRIEQLPFEIKQRLQKEKYPVDEINFSKKINLDEAYIPDTKKIFREIQSIAKKNGGVVLSKQYLGSSISLKFKCSVDHVWETPPSYVKAGNWCPKCAGHGRTIKELQDYAKKHNGILLDKEFLGMRHKYQWQCREGHIWAAAASTIRQGHWCRECALVLAGKKKQTPVTKLKEMAKSKGGRLVSKEYFGSSSKYIWECKKKHRWETTGEVILRGNWCSKCSKNHPKTIEDMRDIAKSKQGFCLSTEYKGVKHKLKWKCSEGHEWDATPDGIINGNTWCSFCASKKNADGSRSSIEKMQKLAELKNGKCLSKIYVNNSTRLEWQCSKKHKWLAFPGHIKKGSWCPRCAKNRPLTIDDMNLEAKNRSGKCLSRVYVNNSTKLEWECSRGHKWKAAPSKIRAGRWCPICRGK